MTRRASIKQNPAPIKKGPNFATDTLAPNAKAYPTNPPHNRNSRLLTYTWKHRDKGDHGEPRAA